MICIPNAITFSSSEIYRFAMLEHKTEEEVISRFVINPVLDQDAGQITCEAANRYGRDQKNFLLSIEGTHFTQFLHKCNEPVSNYNVVS